MPQTESAKAVQMHERVALYRRNHPAADRWAAGYGAIQHTLETQDRIFSMAQLLAARSVQGDGVPLFDLLTAADRIASAGMWLVVHQTYARRVYLDGRNLRPEDFKPHPDGHTGGALNMVPAYMGYMAINALTGQTRAWIMGQGHCVAAVDALNLLLDNMTGAHAQRYSLTDEGLTRYVQDFYAYRLRADGRQDSPLGSHVNAHTAGGLVEGGYLGFTELQYVHMPLPGERLVVFLSDGAFEEQRGSDWTPRWWRAEDCGLVTPIMINNGRRIDQRSTLSQEGGVAWFCQHLRPRVGNPDEMRSNRMQGTLDALHFRVTDPEEAVPETLHGAVITALNEEAVASAALANKGGLNIIVTYEAFGAKMHGVMRQEIIFSQHCHEAGRVQRWLSVPLILTSHTWENGKNEQSHQDPVMAEAMLGENSHVSRVVFPPDANTAAVVLHGVYQTQGQLWTCVVPKASSVPDLFTPDEARRLLADGALRLEWAGHQPEQARLILTAVGAYQLEQVLKASLRLAERHIPHTVVAMLEPGRFRAPRNAGEQAHTVSEVLRTRLYPHEVPARLFVTHTRPEPLLGALQPLHTGTHTVALGFINHGGTLNTPGMLFVNRCTWAHIIAAAAPLVRVGCEKLLSDVELAALDGRRSPQGIVI